MSDSKNSRRQFMKTSFFAALAALPVLSYGQNVFAAKKKIAPAKTEPMPPGATQVPETDPVASAIGYKANPKDKKPEAKDQSCKSCALYTSVNNSWGKCQMLTAGLVSSQGWCRSYSKKPATQGSS